MKKFVSIALILLILIVPNFAKAQEDKPISLIINGKNVEPKESDGKVFVESDRTYVPIRFIMESLKYKVDYDSVTKGITVKNSKYELKMTVGSKDYSVNGEKKSMDVVPKLIDDRLHIPLRFVAESFGEKVSWNQNNYAVIIGSYFDENIDNQGKDEVIIDLEDYKVKMYIPKEIHERLVIKKDDDKTSYTFYDKYSHKEPWTGRIFSISKSPMSVLKIVPGIMIDYDGEYFYEAIFASDVNYDPKDEKAIESYQELTREAKEFLKTASIVR